MAAESRKSIAPSPPDQTPEEDLVIVKVEEDHGWDQESSLHESNPPGQELFRLRFRKLCYQETLGPREALIQLRALCHQWLRPDLNTKEQILELLVLEQFLTILPKELQTLVKEHQLENGEEVVTLLEDLERQIDILGRPVPAHAHGHRVLWEEVVHSESAPEPPDTQPQPVATQHKSPVLQGSQERAMSASQSPTPSQKGSPGDQEMTAALLTAGFQTLEKIEDMAVSLIREEWLLDPSQKDLSRDNRPENYRNMFSLVVLLPQECSGLKIPPDSWDVKTSESYPEPLQTKMSTKLREGAALTPVVHIREEHEGLRIVKVEEEEDHAWEQKPGQQGNEYNYQELLRRRFRQFRYQEAPGPQEALSQLRELCQKWLQPELHSKEQILELLVLEQFLTILPKELQARVWGYHPRSGEEVVTVLENLETELGDKGQQVPGSAHYKQVLWKEVGPGSLAGQSLTVQLKCDPWEHIPLQENALLLLEFTIITYPE
ncbi:hypothetical protein CB1_001664007 [Camelus ferus]|nr:hypothetical protein CB1_001664007 [Camelus ferus]